MSGYRVSHDFDDDPTVHDRQTLGDSSPLVFEDGEAVVDDEQTARDLQRRHAHLSALGPVQEDGASDEEFDAEAFVDRTPMSDVVDDIESGDYDPHLEAIDDVAEREGVKDAVDARREE